MISDALFRLSGASAILGGVLRIGAIVPLTWGAATLEWLYTAIDVLLLFGIMGIYLSRAERLGFLGMASFGVAVAALSFIGGPDANPFGFGTYEQGAAAFAIAMAGLSIAWVRAREQPIGPAACWFGSIIAAGVFNLIPPLSAHGLTVAGALFGLGFVLAGLPLLAPKR
jgi:hypothetical protein